MISTEHLYQLFLQHPHISTDTRKIEPGSIFFALKGDKFDANTFAKQAIEAGAAYVVIDKPDFKFGEQYLLVNDSLTALQDLARHHRQQLKIPVIGLTGTNGKTTTKELIYSVLSQKFHTLATQGNLNNHIGVPLTILNINATHQMAVIEMGANHQKEIAFLCTISQPTHGLITNVGKAHLEGFGGVEGVKKGKGELYDFLKATKGVVFINTDSPELIKMQTDRHLGNAYDYGLNPIINYVHGKITGNTPFLSLVWTRQNEKSHEITSQLTGEYNFHNILAAICIGCFFKLTPDEINKGVEGYQPKNNRSQIVRTATNTLICDYYNANPSSMAVAIENMDKIEAKHKVLILGDMFELGDEAAEEHLAIVKKALSVNTEKIIFVGKEFGKISASSPSLVFSQTNRTGFFEKTEDVAAELKSNPIKNSTVLIKGSRGMALERLVELF
jgi:UDP-N-acetylmuramoyl-tripeptide--D-alanyl-D-alanine ligase